MSRAGRAGLALLAGFLLLAVAVGGVIALLNSTEAPAAAPAPACSAGGHQLAPDQAANAALIVGTTLRRDLPARAGTIGIATALQESWMRNIDFGDRDSLGMFQQRPSQGWGTPEQVMDPVYAVNIFFDHLVRVDNYTEMPVTEAAQAVQRSAFPDAYAKHEPLARSFASALTGWTEANLTCTLEAADGEPAGIAEAVLQRTERDYGLAGVAGDWEQDADGAQHAVAIFDVAAYGRDDAETERLAWAVAQGAVAAASETGAGEVRGQGWIWERTSGQWRELTDQEQGSARGVVVVTS